MKISTKGRYALVIMSYLAKHYDEDRYISLREISDNEGISYKYLEKIIISLNKLTEIRRGNNGGYKLKYAPSEYKIGEILRASEGDLAPVSCVNSFCPKKNSCGSFNFWNGLYKEINNYIDKYTLEDFIKEGK